MTTTIKEGSFNQIQKEVEIQNNTIKDLEVKINEIRRKIAERENQTNANSVNISLINEQHEVLIKENDELFNLLKDFKKINRHRTETSTKVLIAISGLIVIGLIATGITVGIIYN
jgi:cell division septum initiation protein DivIVA